MKMFGRKKKKEILYAPRLDLGMNGHLPEGVEIVEKTDGLFLISNCVTLCKSILCPGGFGYFVMRDFWSKEDTLKDEEKQIVTDVVERAREAMNKRKSDAVKAMVG